MSNKPKFQVFALARRSFASHFAFDAPVLDIPKPLTKEYLDTIQNDIDAKLGPASERKPVCPPGW